MNGVVVRTVINSCHRAILASESPTIHPSVPSKYELCLTKYLKPIQLVKLNKILYLYLKEDLLKLFMWILQVSVRWNWQFIILVL